jgi:hypothetical protein
LSVTSNLSDVHPQASELIASCLRDAVGILRGLEARLSAHFRNNNDDDAIRITAAAHICGYTVGGFRKLLRKDADLCRCYHKAGGTSSRLIFSRKKLEAWKAARS